MQSVFIYPVLERGLEEGGLALHGRRLGSLVVRRQGVKQSHELQVARRLAPRPLLVRSPSSDAGDTRTAKVLRTYRGRPFCCCVSAGIKCQTFVYCTGARAG